ncbi:hypothetical protein [Fusibacter bizertensis]
MLFKSIKARREAELRRQKLDTLKKVGAALVISSVVSTVVTLFTAPKSGKELRSDVVNKVEEGADLVKESAAKFAQKTSDVAQDALIKGHEIKDKAVNKFTQVTSDLGKTMKEKKNHVESTSEAIREDIEETVEAVSSEINELKEEVSEEIHG